MYRTLIAVVLAAASAHAPAVVPESGWWWNAAESGRGFSIEVQNQTVFMAGYLYDAAGNATWVVASGPYDDAGDSFAATLQTFVGGQCITCPYRAPSAGPSPGGITLRFASPATGSLTWAGGTVPITRFYYGVGPRADRLLGTWALSAQGSTTVFAEWIGFTRMSNDPQLGQVALGTLLTNGRPAIAWSNPAGTEVSVLLDVSSSFYELYRFPVTFLGSREGFGLWWTYVRGGSPSGSGRLGIASRILPSGASTMRDAPKRLDDADYASLVAAARRLAGGSE